MRDKGAYLKEDGMIYVTGDTHIPIDIRKLSSKRFAPKKDEQAYLIICGDFGGV